MARRKPAKVMGVDAPAPRPTWAAVRLVLAYVGVPVLAALLAFDVAVWLVFDLVWDVCVGLWCWL